MTLRVWAAVAVLLMSGCSREKPKPTPSAIVSSSVAPGSPFKTRLAIEPAKPIDGKPETFILTVTDTSGKPVTGALVAGELVMPVMDMGRNTFAMRETDAGVYRGTGTTAMSGEWEVQFTITAAGLTGKHGYHVVFEADTSE
jgi:YtkA-like protein